MKKVRELIEERNRIDAEIASIEKEYQDVNTRILIKEVMNLLDGVGDGFVEGDYYAPRRYYSDILGVKNIRLFGDSSHPQIIVKVISPRGYLLPNEVEIRGVKYKLYFTKSSNFSGGVDY